MDALELANAVKNKKAGVAELVIACVNEIEKQDKTINAFITIMKEQALARADVVQKQIDDGDNLSPLAGVPVAIKDNISTRDVLTSCASKSLQGYSPIFNAAVVDKLENSGLIIVGKLNMDEFAMGGSTETGIFGTTKNPRNPNYIAGGSSGGSAAAVAAGMVPLALGTDTGGSIRQPCGYCGVIGIKPTYGAVSRHGLIAFASSMDQIGPIGRNVDDCAALLSIISGPDNRDSTCAIGQSFCFDRKPEKTDSLSGRKIALPINYLEDCDDEIKRTVMTAVKRFESLGAEIDEIVMPHTEYSHTAYRIISCAEAGSNLSRYDGVKYGYKSPNAHNLSDVYNMSRAEGFGPEVKRRIMLGSLVLSDGYYDIYYKKSLKIRTLV
ncbi:MAG: aspartyl/glutamyl-tRNA amidotransferase subunit A, partial [Oscillospiraceae bacterium]|nr:aspartyl/glutamyl-tRNA amidotransferase subunit A [Oscillospiraceae bacterium]